VGVVFPGLGGSRRCADRPPTTHEVTSVITGSPVRTDRQSSE